jgi:ribosomal protein L11 methyltransferase
MSFLRFTLATRGELVDSVSSLLEKFEATAISYEANSDEKLFAGVEEEPRYWSITSISALLDSEIDMDILLACIRNQLGTENIYSHKIQLIQDQDWVDNHKQGVEPRVFSDRLCICPSWLEMDKEYEANLILDPGLAFGTGSHPTTRLCLQWLSNRDLKDLRVIDYGCGSGILALAAASLGAGQVFGVDIDPQAHIATRSNATINQLEHLVSVLDMNDNELAEVDLLMANILLNPLLDLAENFSRLIKPGGMIVLSGILATQVDECLATYNQWFTIQGREFIDEWALLYGIRC